MQHADAGPPPPARREPQATPRRYALHLGRAAAAAREAHTRVARRARYAQHGAIM